jgi:cytochrome c6
VKGSGTGLFLLALAVVCLGQEGCGGSGRDSGKSGQELFQLYCSGCHPNGGNVIYPQKTLDRLTLKANGVRKPDDIVALMRNPGRGMKKFDRGVISDTDAMAVAQYVSASFN